MHGYVVDPLNIRDTLGVYDGNYGGTLFTADSTAPTSVCIENEYEGDLLSVTVTLVGFPSPGVPLVQRKATNSFVLILSRAISRYTNEYMRVADATQ